MDEQKKDNTLSEDQQKTADKLHVKALEHAKKKGMYFIEDVIAFLPISKDTFYRYWKVGSDSFDAIRDLLDENKIQTKVDIREKLAKGTKAPELLALYKLLGTDEERRKLSSQYVDHTTKGKELKAPTIINYGDLDEKTLEDIIANTEAAEEKKEGEE